MLTPWVISSKVNTIHLLVASKQTVLSHASSKAHILKFLCIFFLHIILSFPKLNPHFLTTQTLGDSISFHFLRPKALQTPLTLLAHTLCSIHQEFL